MRIAKRIVCLSAMVGLGAAISFGADSAMADLDCPDFRYQEDAQDYFETNGGSRNYNFDLLDADGDGIACELNTHRSLLSGSTSGRSDSSEFDLPSTYPDYDVEDSDSDRKIPWIPLGLAAAGGVYYWKEMHGPQNRRATPSPGRTYDPRKMDYQAYLQTSEWHQLRQMAFTRDGYKCRHCGSTENLQAHHLTYARRGREKVKDLITLCPKCHEAAHRKPIR